MRDNLYATVVGQRAGTDQESIDRLLREARKGCVDLATSPGMDDVDFLPDSRSGHPDVRQEGLGIGPIGIDECGDAHGSRHQLVQESKLFLAEVIRHEVDTSHVAARPIKTGNEVALDRVEARCEDGRYRRGYSLGCRCRRGVGGGNYCHLAAYQIDCEVGQSIVLVLCPAIFDRHVLTFDVATLADTLPKCIHKMRPAHGRRAAQEADHRHCRLLRTRSERPPDSRTAEQPDELAPPHIRTQTQGPALYRLKRLL